MALRVQSQQRGGVSLATLLTVLAVAWAATLLAWHKADAWPGAASRIWFWAIVFRLFGLFGQPVLEDDYFRYLWDGYRMATKADPYSLHQRHSSMRRRARGAEGGARRSESSALEYSLRAGLPVAICFRLLVAARFAPTVETGRHCRRSGHVTVTQHGGHASRIAALCRVPAADSGDGILGASGFAWRPCRRGHAGGDTKRAAGFGRLGGSGSLGREGDGRAGRPARVVARRPAGDGRVCRRRRALGPVPRAGFLGGVAGRGGRSARVGIQLVVVCPRQLGRRRALHARRGHGPRAGPGCVVRLA